MSTARIVADVILEYAASILGKRIQNKVVGDLSLRKNQIYMKNVDIKKKDWSPTTVSIQKHDAKRRGTHYDFRVAYKGRLVSFVMNDLPSSKPQNVIRTIDHKMDYANFEGIIPDGEFGAGRVKLLYNGPALMRVKTDNGTSIKVMIPDGKVKGVYAFVHYGDDIWMTKKMDLPELIRLHRRDYKISDMPSKENLEGKIAEEKIDGAYSTIVIGKEGTSISGRKLDKDSKIIDYTYKLPHIAEIKSKRYAGTILNGEVFYKDVRNTSRVLNSNPENAISIGKPSIYLFDIRKLVIDGKEIELNNYKDVIRYRNDIAKLSDYFKIPKIAYDSDILKLYKKAKEGIVIKDDNLNDKWIKVVKRKSYDLKIIGMTDGDGKYKGRGIGAFIVADDDQSHIANAGTGLNDDIRIDAYNHPDKYIGKILTIEAKEVTNKSLRAPVVINVRNDKDVADNL